MPEHIRALIAILVLAGGSFALINRPLMRLPIEPHDLKRRSILWLVVTGTAFLSHNIWLFFLLAGMELWWARLKERSTMPLYFFLLFAIPPMTSSIEGLAGIQQLFSLNYPRLLALIVLLPGYFVLRRRPDTPKFGQFWADRFLLCYIAMEFFLRFPFDTFTNTLRASVLYKVTDVLLPYYMASRGIRTLPQWRDSIASLSIGGMVLGVLAVVEYIKGWLLYAALPGSLGLSWNIQYLGRGGADVLRALTTTSHSIVMGYTIAVIFLLYFSLRRTDGRNSKGWKIGAVLLGFGLFAPLARGPWIGFVAGWLVFMVTGPSVLERVGKVALTGVIITFVLLPTPFGAKLVDYLPFVGTVDAGNVDYRKQLFDVSLIVIANNPWFGAYDYMLNPLMEQMRQGQGIIDIVNSYLGITLAQGLVGLGIFLSIFVSVLFGLWRCMLQLPKDGELHQIGRAVLGAVVTMMITIATCSTLDSVAMVYWILAGLAVGYIQLVRDNIPLLDGRLAHRPDRHGRLVLGR
jgi:hypothetical protein